MLVAKKPGMYDYRNGMHKEGEGNMCYKTKMTIRGHVLGAGSEKHTGKLQIRNGNQIRHIKQSGHWSRENQFDDLKLNSR
jgi:hypothetical protein